MKLIKAPQELPVDEKDFILISRLGGTQYLYGNTYWLIQVIGSITETDDLNLDVKTRLENALAPLRAELKTKNEIEQDYALDDWFGRMNVTTLTYKNLSSFLEFYELSGDPEFINTLGEIETLDGYNVAKLLLLQSLDTVIQVSKELEEVE